MNNILATERAADTTNQAARFTRAAEHIKATDGRDIVIETEGSKFRVTVWSDQGRQYLFGANAQTLNSAVRKGAAFVYGRTVARLI